MYNVCTCKHLIFSLLVFLGKESPNEIPESPGKELSSLEFKSSLTPSEPAIAITRDRSRTDINKMLMESHGVPNSPKQQLTSAEQASNDTHGNQATANDDIEAANLHSDKIRQARIDSNYYAQGLWSPFGKYLVLCL